MKISKRKICLYRTKLDLIILVLSLLAVLVTILCCKSADNQIGILGLITIIGFVFSFYHFIYKLIQERNHKIYDIRYLAYKEVIRAIDEYASLLPRVLPVSKEADIDELYASTFNGKNRIASSLKNDFEYAFPDIVDCDLRKRLSDFVDNLNRKVTNLRNDLINEKSSEQKIIFQNNFYSNNNIFLKEFYETKGEFFLYIRKKL